MKIGISLPLSISSPNDIDVESVAHDVLNAIRHSQNYLQTNHELIIIDNKNTEAGATTAIEELAKQKVQIILGLPTSDEVHRSVAALKKFNLIAITSMATSPKLNNYAEIFRARCSDLNGIKLLADHIQAKNPKDALIFSEKSAYAADFGDLLAKELSFHKVQNKFIAVDRQANTLENILNQIETIDPDAVCISTQDEETFYAYVKTIRKKYGKIQIYASSMAGSSKFHQLAKQEANDIVYVTAPKLAACITEQGKDFIESFEKEYGPAKTGLYAIILTHAAFVAADQALKSNKPIAETLNLDEFSSPIVGNFRFKEREIYSQNEIGENRFCQQEVVRLGF